MVATVDEYLAGLPDASREVVERIRAAIHDAVPGCGEKIAYRMPTFTLDGRSLVHVGAWSKHIGVYPLPADAELEPELAPYRAKGVGRFPLTGPVPVELIGRIARSRAQGL